MLGDMIHNALDSVGITTDRVEKWLGKPCHCQERQEKLNQLDQWARRVMKGRIDKAAEYLDKLLSEG